MPPTRTQSQLIESAPVGVQGKWAMIGSSVEGRAIEAVRFAGSRDTVLVMSGMHGDEPKSVSVARRLVDVLNREPALVEERRVTVVPLVNPDGYERRNRRNANKVDLNRNFPTEDWAESSRRSRFYSGAESASEPETRAVMKLIDRLRPQRIVNIHSIGRHQFCNNYNGPALELAKAMSAANGYPVTATIGYPTPGSFGTWAGIERNIPTITLELPSHHSPKRCWHDNRDALLAFVCYSAGPEAR